MELLKLDIGSVYYILLGKSNVRVGGLAKHWPEGTCNSLAYKDMWQSLIEIEYYSVAYFERITEFDAL